MKVAYSASCFSNDSDTIVRMLSGSSWISADYWTEVARDADVWVRLWLSDNWYVFSVDSVYCIFVYKWPHPFIHIYT